MADTQTQRCRSLVIAILDQACCDLIGYRGIDPVDRRSAINFVDERNELFCYYCELLDMEPEYVAKKIHENVNYIKSRKLRYHREPK